jgi:hypothetical protein
MHHYRCQNGYISATDSERIEDTLEFFPHNYQMPQLSSTDRLLMAANEMSNSLQYSHPEVPFTHVGYDTISALIALAEIFKLKFEKVHIPIIPAPPAQVTQRIRPTESSNPILTSPVPPTRPMRSQKTIHTRAKKKRAIISEGGHTNVESDFTSEGAKTLTKSCPPATCLKTTSVEWTPITWPSTLGITIGARYIKPMQSFTPSPDKKWKIWPL